MAKQLRHLRGAILTDVQRKRLKGRARYQRRYVRNGKRQARAAAAEEYGTYMRRQLRAIAAGLGVSYEDLTSDPSFHVK